MKEKSTWILIKKSKYFSKYCVYLIEKVMALVLKKSAVLS